MGRLDNTRQCDINQHSATWHEGTLEDRPATEFSRAATMISSTEFPEVAVEYLMTGVGEAAFGYIV